MTNGVFRLSGSYNAVSNKRIPDTHTTTFTNTRHAHTFTNPSEL